MKLKKIQKYKNKLIQLQILKLYCKKKSLNNYNLKQIEIYLNKISNIIYKYHITNKKILFVGFPIHFLKTLQNTKHLLIPEFVWFQGMLSNRGNENKKTSFHTFKLVTKLKKKMDLIVIYNFNERINAIEESSIARIPVIAINKKQNILNFKTTYKSIGSYSIIDTKAENSNLFLSFIKTTLNKAKKTQKVKIYNKNFINIYKDIQYKKSFKNSYTRKK